MQSLREDRFRGPADARLCASAAAAALHVGAKGAKKAQGRQTKHRNRPWPFALREMLPAACRK